MFIQVFWPLSASWFCHHKPWLAVPPHAQKQGRPRLSLWAGKGQEQKSAKSCWQLCCQLEVSNNIIFKNHERSVGMHLMMNFQIPSVLQYGVLIHDRSDLARPNIHGSR